MLRWVATGSSGIALLVLAFGVAPAPAVTPGSHTLSVTLSSSHAGARPVAVSANFAYEMQCGYPGPGPVVLSFPAAERLPAVLARSAVLVDGKAAPSVKASGRSLTIGLAPPPQVMCDEIGPGTLTIQLTRAVGLGNPSRAGTYRLTATRGAASFSTRFAIR